MTRARTAPGDFEAMHGAESGAASFGAGLARAMAAWTQRALADRLYRRRSKMAVLATGTGDSARTSAAAHRALRASMHWRNTVEFAGGAPAFENVTACPHRFGASRPVT